MHIVKKSNQGGVLCYTTQKNLTPFNTPGQGLYAWVTESKYKLSTKGETSAIKFGQYGANAKEGTLPQDTILGYSGTTTEPIIILWAKRFSDDEIKKGNAYQIEQIVNKQIGSRYEDSKSTEVFYTTVDTIKAKVNETLYGSVKLDSYSPRQSQQSAIDKMVHCFSEGETDFLLGAIMRYGKNFTFLTTCSKLLKNSGNILVLTNKPNVFSSLKNDINSHVYFDGWEYFELKDVKDKDKLQLDPNKISVVACSKQLADNMVSGRGTRKFLSNQDWDFSFFDECHSGTDTNNFISLNKMLNIKHRVWASGTPFKTAAAGGFEESNSYYYGYVEQQKDKLKGICPDAVTLETYVPSINPQFVNNPNFSDEEGFTLTKMFAFEDDRFIFGGELREFISEVLGKSLTKSKYSPMRKCEGRLDHTVWLLPANIKMIEGLTKLIEDIAPEYKVLNATGNNVTCIDKVHNAIKHNNKTITLTNMRFVEGVTVPNWTGAFVLSDTESVEKYFQFIFRVASPLKNKDKAFVFDFDPERCFSMIFEMSTAHAINNNETDSQEAIREWLDCMPVYRTDVNLKQIDVSDILNQILNIDYSASTLLKTSHNYINSIKTIEDKDDLSSMLETVLPVNNISISSKMVQNGMSKGKSYRQGRNNSEQEPIDVDTLNDIMKRIASVVSSLPLLSWLSDSKTVEGILKDLGDDVIEDALGVSKNVMSYLINKNYIDTRYINLYL